MTLDWNQSRAIVGAEAREALLRLGGREPALRVDAKLPDDVLDVEQPRFFGPVMQQAYVPVRRRPPRHCAPGRLRPVD